MPAQAEKNIRGTSVEIIKEEKVIPGMIRNKNPPNNAFFNFFVIQNIL